MADLGSSHNAAFSDGLNFTQNTGRGNDSSVTLTDGGLDATSARWAALTPKGIVSGLTGDGAGDDSPFERVQRTSGSYDAGSLPEFEDNLTNGSDQE